MVGKSGFLRAVDKAREEGFMTGQHFVRQLCMDQAAIVLNREFGFGADRLKKFNDAMVEMYGTYATIWNGDTKDVEYSKAAMDRALEQIYGDKFMPWDERYK